MDDHWVGFTSSLMKIVPKLGDIFADKVMFTDHDELDDEFGWQVSMHHFPSGASLKQVQHWAQIFAEDRFQEYAEGYSQHGKHNSGKKTELYPLEDIKVPIALFQGIEDKIADAKDAKWTADQVGQNLIHYEEIHANHNTFAIGKDMTYFKDTVINLLNEYHPISKVEKPLIEQEDSQVPEDSIEAPKKAIEANKQKMKQYHGKK